MNLRCVNLPNIQLEHDIITECYAYVCTVVNTEPSERYARLIASVCVCVCVCVRGKKNYTCAVAQSNCDPEQRSYLLAFQKFSSGMT
jgi:hypothetical protein